MVKKLIKKRSKTHPNSRLIYLNEVSPHIYPNGSKQRKWKVKCDCGNTLEALLGNLSNGNTLSCGCYHIDKLTTHGFTSNELYAPYLSMMDRCYNKNNSAYINYGGRGIKVCKRWRIKKNHQGLKNFIKDMESTYKIGLWLERKDNDKGYSPDNCTWTTPKKQSRNRRTTKWIVWKNGKKIKLRTAWRKYSPKGLAYITVFDRVNRGWNPVRAILTPKLTKGGKIADL